MKRQTWSHVLLLAGLVAWAGWSATLAYDFASSAARTGALNELEEFHLVVTRLPAGLSRVVSGLLFLASALGLGHLALRCLRLRWHGSGERALLEVAAGLMAWTYFTLALGSAGLLRREVFLFPFAAGLAAAAWGWLRPAAGAWSSGTDGTDAPGTVSAGWRNARLRLSVEVLTGALLALFLYLALLGALGPEVQYDGRWYHLAQVKHYLQRGSLYNMVAETRISVVGLPAYHQLLLTGIATVFDLPTAKLFPWFECLLAVAMLVCVCCHHFGNRLMGLVAALLFVSTPLVSWFASTSGNDLAVVLFSLFAIHSYLRWRAEPAARGWLVFLGVLGGFAAGVKPFALSFLLVLSLGILVESLWPDPTARTPGGRFRRAGTGLAIVGAAALLAVSPWLVRSYLTTGNPTFPFLDGLLFDSPYWNEALGTLYRSAVRQYGVDRTLGWFLLLPVRTVTRAHNHRALIGPLFLAFLPFIAVRLVTARDAAGALVRRLALYAALVVTLWFCGGLLETRYVAFVIPALTLLVAFVLVEPGWTGRTGKALHIALAVVALAVTLLNAQPFVFLQTFGTDPSVAGRLFVPWGFLYRGAPEVSVHGNGLPIVTYINQHLVPGRDKVYDGTYGQVTALYLYSDVELFNGEGWDGSRALGEWSLESRDAPSRMARAGITHVVVDRSRWPASRLDRCVLRASLRELWESPDGMALYRFDVGSTKPK
jgi:hypothetical protein